MKANLLYENICGNRKSMGLVSLMRPTDLMKTLVKLVDIRPKDAAKLVYDLRKKAEGVSGGTIETNKEYPIPSSMRDEGEDDEDLDEASSVRMGPDPVQRHHFPPDPREKEKEWPYSATNVNYMNNPKRKLPLTSGKDPLDRNDDPLDIDMISGDPASGGDGGLSVARKSFQKRGGDMPGAGSGWNRQGGAPGWAGAPADKTFDMPRMQARQMRKQDEHQDNAGDDDGEPSFLKQPNTGGTYWDPKTGQSGTSNWRKKPWRGYGRR